MCYTFFQDVEIDTLEDWQALVNENTNAQSLQVKVNVPKNLVALYLPNARERYPQKIEKNMLNSFVAYRVEQSVQVSCFKKSNFVSFT